MGATTVRVAARAATFAAPSMPDLRRRAEWGDDWVRFVQTVGGRTALPAPRRVNHPPFVQLRAPLVWSTLALTFHADGRCEYEMLGASIFPRHWVYDADGKLVGQGRARRLQAVVPARVRQALAVGQRELADVRHRGRDRARARPRDARSCAAARSRRSAR